MRLLSGERARPADSRYVAAVGNRHTGYGGSSQGTGISHGGWFNPESRTEHPFFDTDRPAQNKT